MQQRSLHNRTRRFHRVLAGAAVITAVTLAGCAESADVSRITAPTFEPRFVSNNSNPGLLECPVNVTRSASATIGPLGGTLSLDGTSIMIPPLAVALPTSFTLTIPASNYMEVRFTADGSDHFEFLKPVSATISYARCTRSDLNKLSLTVWHIDPNTKALLANMNGTDDKTARTVSFGTDHFSGYSIGYGTEPPPSGEN